MLINNDLLFIKDVPYLEDGEYIARVFCMAKHCNIYDIPYYYRLNRPGSATQSDLFSRKNSIIGFLLAARNLEEFKNSHQLSSEQVGLINGKIIKFVLLPIRASINDLRKYYWVKNQLKSFNLLKIDLNHTPSHHHNLGKQYNLQKDLLYMKFTLDNVRNSFKIRLKTLLK